jgi:hypothetical protein
MMKRLLSFLLGIALPLLVAAAPVERDLGQGLVYVRVHALPADLPPKPAGRLPTCIVDMRYVDADAEAAAAFSTWLKSRAAPRSPVFVLANADTSAAVLKTLSTLPRGGSMAVVGVEGGQFRPDVAVKISPEDDRRAYEALEKGTPIAALLADNPNKVRNDEASLSKDRVAEASADAADETLAGKRTPPPIDATLQRAVHLHRSLVALKRL